MWEHFEKYENGGISINRQCSFYVGDAAGRICSSLRGKKDHSAADRLFALNIGINFFTPEQYFLKQTHIENYILPSFSPSLSLDAKLCLFEPEDTAVPGEGPEVLVFVGYPGSGKSFLANKLARDYGYEIVNRDTLKTWQKCVENAKILLKRKQSVIVDNTNADAQSRKRFCDVAKSFGAVARCFVFNCTFEQAAHNCKYRVIIGTDEAHSDVGRMVLNTYRNKFQDLWLPLELPKLVHLQNPKAAHLDFQEPTLAEGFSSIVRVNFVPEFACSEHERIYRMYLCDS
ncbi:unnamed protein product [Gongylonema pulchrum]|uniref:Bifunctional polynucleotide phosphatase/kinase n=1 Tax=Gongylonema pulchrum TaxID=637853 RepID=A0A183EHX8_9BILA|nr:unnamed protein product [Gongylonema pulchrum]